MLGRVFCQLLKKNRQEPECREKPARKTAPTHKVQPTTMPHARARAAASGPSAAVSARMAGADQAELAPTEAADVAKRAVTFSPELLESELVVFSDNDDDDDNDNGGDGDLDGHDRSALTLLDFLNMEMVPSSCCSVDARVAQTASDAKVLQAQVPWGDRSVIIVGAGLSGLLVAHALVQYATKLVILEQNGLDSLAPMLMRLSDTALAALETSAAALTSSHLEYLGALRTGTAEWIVDRAALLRLLARSLLRFDHVCVVTQARVQGLVANSDARLVAGVILESGQVLESHLVVCATGANSPLQAWMKQHDAALELETVHLVALPCEAQQPLLPVQPAQQRWPSRTQQCSDAQHVQGFFYDTDVMSAACWASTSKSDATTKLRIVLGEYEVAEAQARKHAAATTTATESRAFCKFDSKFRGILVVGDALALQDSSSDAGALAAAQQANIVGEHLDSLATCSDKVQARLSFDAWTLFVRELNARSPSEPLGVLGDMWHRVASSLAYDHTWARSVLFG